MRAPPTTRSERLRRWLDELARFPFTNLSQRERDRFAGVLGEMREAWRDELRLELAQSERVVVGPSVVLVTPGDPPPSSPACGTWCPAVQRILTEAEQAECAPRGCVGAYCARYGKA